MGRESLGYLEKRSFLDDEWYAFSGFGLLGLKNKKYFLFFKLHFYQKNELFIFNNKFTQTNNHVELIFRISLLIAGIVNILPALLVFFPAKIANSYGIAIPDSNYELLLRHRAVLFFIVGGLLVYSSITQKAYAISTVVGLISMLSFVLLYYLIGKNTNAQLKKVMFIDVAAIIVLFVGAVLYYLGSEK